MTAAITDPVFHRIALLSRLPVSDKDNYIKDQLSEAADYIEVLNELNIDNVEPTYQVNHKQNVFRSDDVVESLPQAQALSQAPKQSGGYFVTSATIKK